MCSFLYFLMIQFAELICLNEDPRMDQFLKIAIMVDHGLGAKLATDLLLLISLVRLIWHRKFTSSLSAGIRALCFLSGNLLFCNLIEAFF